LVNPRGRRRPRCRRRDLHGRSPSRRRRRQDRWYGRLRTPRV